MFIDLSYSNFSRSVRSDMSEVRRHDIELLKECQDFGTVLGYKHFTPPEWRRKLSEEENDGIH